MHRPLVVALACGALILGGGAVSAQSGSPPAAPKPAAAKPASKAATETAAAKPSENSTAAPAGEPAKEAAKIDGFRSANFGMTESQVRTAIRKDFSQPADKISVEENSTEKTTVLSIAVPDLLPDAGPAKVSYILGFKSKKLVQINVVWGSEMAASVPPEKVVGAANTLRQYFLGLGFPPDSVVANARANDGSIIVFQGIDAQKRAVLLRLLGGTPPEKADAPPPAIALTLSYIQDPQNPDIFRINKGQF